MCTQTHTANSKTVGRLVWLLRVASTSLGLGVLLLGCLEFFYRFQVVDMYKPELLAYNSSKDLTEGRDTLLALGDSFTAGSSYLSYLRPLLPQYRIINGGISGTGVVQASLVARRRFHQFRPSIFIYQVYVGNDLFDLRYPINWRTMSATRNLFWIAAQRLRVLSFFNYRLAQLIFTQKFLQRAADNTTDMKTPFSPERYTERPVLYLKAEPGLIEDTVLAKGNRAADYLEYLGLLRNMLAVCQSPCEAYILVIPHCAQVNSRYLNNFRNLGAVFSIPDALESVDYPFISRLRQELSSIPNVKVVNALPVLRAAEEQGEEVYFRNDDHLTPKGHEIVAALLNKEISRLQPTHR